MSEVLYQPTLSTALNEDVEQLLARGERALLGEGDLRSSREWFDAAYRRAEREDDADAMARAALGLGGLWVHEHRTMVWAAAVQARQRRALSLVDPGSSLALRLRARLAGEDDYQTGQSAEILAVLDEATAAGDPVARAEALSLAHHCVLGPDHAALRRDLAGELVAQSVRTSRRSDLLMGLLWQTVDLLLAADPHAERCLGQVRELLSRKHHLAVGFVVNAIDVMLCIRAGRLELAETQAGACASRGEAVGDRDAHGWYGGHLVAIRWYQGRLAELVPMLGEMVHSPTLSSVDNSYFAALAVAAATAGDRRAAAGALARLRGRDLADLPRSSSWLVTMYGIVEAAHLLDDADLSSRAYDLLSPYAGIPMVASLGVACFGSVRHALGVASLTAGDVDRAIKHLRGAVHDNMALGHWPAVVLSRARLAQALMTRGSLKGEADDVVAGQAESAAAAHEAAAMGIPVPEFARGKTTDRVWCRRLGRQWQVTMGDRRAMVEHSVGMLHLATLLANPGREISAVDLAAGPAETGQTSPAQPVLDAAAKRHYRQRLAQLSAEIDEFEAHHDLEHAARAREERDWLLSELSAATGVAGRPRHFANDDERARIAVGKAIRRALGRIAQVDPIIGRHLENTIGTGRRCVYQPG